MLSKDDILFSLAVIIYSIVLAIIVFKYNINLPETGIIKYLIDISLYFISNSSYTAIFVLMMMESALIPIPSEVVMPFSGFLCYLNKLSLPLVVLTATLANLVGSLIAYWLGFHYGRPFLEKYGKYLLISKEHLEYAEYLFTKHGEAVILISRMLPAIRTVISFPAGVGKMDIRKFLIYTFIGSLPWNFMLTYIGYIFGENWFVLFELFRKIDIIIILDIIFVLLWLIRKMKKV